MSSSTLCRVCRRRSIEAGKHVLVEFPLALSHDAAVSLYDLADKHSLYFFYKSTIYTHVNFEPVSSVCELCGRCSMLTLLLTLPLLTDVLVYEEDISLLTESMRSLSDLIKDKPAVVEGESTLEGTRWSRVSLVMYVGKAVLHLPCNIVCCSRTFRAVQWMGGGLH